MEKDDPFTSSSFEAAVEFLFDQTAEKKPEYIRQSEKAVSGVLKQYTLDVMRTDNMDISTILEENMGQVLSAVSEANYMYFENGMKLGAKFLLYLIGCL